MYSNNTVIHDKMHYGFNSVWYLTTTKDAPFLLAVWPCKDPEFTNVVELTESSMRKCNVLYDFKMGISTETSAICSEISLS